VEQARTPAITWASTPMSPLEDRACPQVAGRAPDRGSQRRWADQGHLPEHPVLPAAAGPARCGQGDQAVGHSILVAAYHVLDRGVTYHDLGADWFVRPRQKPSLRTRRRGKRAGGGVPCARVPGAPPLRDTRVHGVTCDNGFHRLLTTAPRVGNAAGLPGLASCTGSVTAGRRFPSFGPPCRARRARPPGGPWSTGGTRRRSRLDRTQRDP